MTAFSIILSLILISVTIFNLKILDSERQFHEKHLSWFKAYHVLELAREDVFVGLTSGDITAGDEGILQFQQGSVNYKVTYWTSGVYTVQFDVQLNESGRSSGLMYYDYVNQEVIKWMVV